MAQRKCQAQDREVGRNLSLSAMSRSFRFRSPPGGQYILKITDLSRGSFGCTKGRRLAGRKVAVRALRKFFDQGGPLMSGFLAILVGVLYPAAKEVMCP